MPNELLKIEADVFRAYFNRKPFYVQSHLTDHPLFGLPRLVELARNLPAEYVEYSAGRVPVNAPPRNPANGLSVEETLRRIEECGSWMVLKRVEQVPAYRRLLDQCLDEIHPFAAEHAPKMFDRQGFIFISSPGSVTPFHMDPEHNFLLQIRGRKTVNMWDPTDRFVVSEQDLETFHSAFVHRNLPYRDVFQTTAYVLPLEAGQGLHFPVDVPHWVKNGDQVSISFSITFRTELSERQEFLYRANARLRKLGLSPTPIGHSPVRDATKHLAAAAWIRARELLHPARQAERRLETSTLLSEQRNNRAPSHP